MFYNKKRPVIITGTITNILMYKKIKKAIGAGTLIALVENIKNLKMLQKVLSSIFIQLLCYHKKFKKIEKNYEKT